MARRRLGRPQDGSRDRSLAVPAHVPLPGEPPQNLKEYDPKWSRASWEGTVAKNCPHETLLAQVKRPVLLTHHMRYVNPETGNLLGAMTDLQAAKARELMAAAGVPIEYASLPDAAHAMHNIDPKRFADLVAGWEETPHLIRAPGFIPARAEGTTR